MQDLSFTVDSLTEICKNTFTSPIEERIIKLEGFYSPGNNKKYGGVYYDILHDENKLSKFTLVVPARLREDLVSKQYYVFEGHLNKTTNNFNDGTIKLQFKATKLKGRKDEFQFITKAEFSVVQERFKRPIPFLDQLLLDKILNDQKPVINIITGTTSIVGEDYRGQLIDSEFYTINEHQVNLSNSQEIGKKIQLLSKVDSDILIVMRGGGSGLEIFNDVALCKASLECNMPFVTAIGHQEDVTLLEKCADKGFGTPTAFGSFLQSIVDRYRNQIKDRTILNERITVLEKDLALVSKDREERLLKAENSIKEEILRGERDKVKVEQIFKNRERQYLFVSLALLILLIVCLLIIFV